MKKFSLFSTAIAVIGGVFGMPLAFQDSGEAALVPVQSIANFDAEFHGRELRSGELDKRRKAYERLLDWSAKSPEVLTAIEAWARGDQLELAWSAELLLRERKLLARGNSMQSSWPGVPRPTPFQRQNQLLLDLRDIFQSPFGDWSQHPSQGGWIWPDQLQDGWSSAGGTAHASSEEFKYSSTPDGVKIEWKEVVDGEEVLRTYEAESLEALLQEHPELGDRLPFDKRGELNPWNSLRRRLERQDHGSWRQGFQLPQQPAGPMRMDILGVQVGRRDPMAKAIPGVEDGHGLTIQSVLPNSIAQRLGLQVGETILLINDTRIGSVGDVQSALRMRSKEESLRVEVCDQLGTRSMREWDPSTTQSKVY